MRTIISLACLLTIIQCYSQRITFEDPDLTFSFKKPKDWQVFDDGYWVKVSPSTQDTATTYFSMTYFESAVPSGPNPFNSISKEFEENVSFKIARVPAELLEKDHATLELKKYTFYKFGQRFELQTSNLKKSKSNDIKFRKIIKSIKISE